MPKNNRPGFFATGWEGKSYADIQKAQNEWDLLKAQEDLVKEMKKQNSQKTEPQYKLEPKEYTYIDYAELAHISRNELIGYMNKYNRQVNSEIPNADKFIEKEDKLNYKMNMDKSNREITKSVSITWLLIINVFIFIIAIAVLLSNSFDLLPVAGITIGIMLILSFIWIKITNVYINIKYDTKEQDKQKVKNVSTEKIDSPTYRRFRQFRQNHYNEYMEHLIDEYTVSRIKYYFNPKKSDEINIDFGGHGGSDFINSNEIMAYGTPEDYMNYLRENFK